MLRGNCRSSVFSIRNARNDVISSPSVSARVDALLWPQDGLSVGLPVHGAGWAISKYMGNMVHMKTMLDIRDELLVRAKRHARATGRPLRAVVEEGLRQVLAASV